MDHQTPSTSNNQGNKRRRGSSSPSPSPPSPLNDSRGHGDDDDADSLSSNPLVMMGDATATTPPPPLVTPSTHHNTIIKKSSLAAFLSSDIKPQEGQRLLLPFLTTNDRLRLSECSHDLRPYRSHLWRVKLVLHPSPMSAMKRVVEEMLARVEYLRLIDKSLLCSLELLEPDGLKRVKVLDMADLKMDGKDAGYVARALVRGQLASLEELHVHVSEERSMKKSGVHCVIEALGHGACPRLRRLALVGIDNPMFFHAIPLDRPMAEAMESGHLRHLRDLDSSGSDLDYNMASIAGALGRGSCPQLARLNLMGCKLSAKAGLALGAAMRAGGCAKLEDLNLGDTRPMCDQGYVAILQSVEVGSCPNLKRLDLTNSRMGLQAAIALGHFLRSDSCQHLESLQLYWAFSSPDASLHVLQAIHQAGGMMLPNLRGLDFYKTDMGQEHGRLLGEAIGDQALPKLERLLLKSSNALGDDGVLPILTSLEGGGCPRLKELWVGGAGMGPEGGQALVRVLSSGKLSSLQSLALGSDEGPGDVVMKEVIERLKRCRQLQEISLYKTGMGKRAGGALIQGLRAGVWPQLRRLQLSFNLELAVTREVMHGLPEVIEGGKLPHLEVFGWQRPYLTPDETHRLLGAAEMGCPRLKRVAVDGIPDEKNPVIVRLRGRGVKVDGRLWK